MRFCVLVNSEAGSVEGEGHVQAIEDALAAAGAQAEVAMVPPDEFGAIMRRAWDGPDRPDAVLVAGGDGTVNCAACEAAGTDIVLGVLPLGTFNHFAKDLDMPADLDEAAAALVAGQVRPIDIAEVNGRAFVNNSALGVYPEMVSIRDRIREQRGWGKVRAVPVAGYRVLRDFPIHRLDLTGPGYQRRRVRTPLVFIGNGVFDNTDGGLVVRNSLTDGQLGVSVARVVSRWRLVTTALRVLLAGAANARDLDVVQLPELTVSARTRRLRVALDGEVVWLQTPLHYRCRPGGLNVLGPAAPARPDVREADPVS